MAAYVPFMLIGGWDNSDKKGPLFHYALIALLFRTVILQGKVTDDQEVLRLFRLFLYGYHLGQRCADAEPPIVKGQPPLMNEAYELAVFISTHHRLVLQMSDIYHTPVSTAASIHACFQEGYSLALSLPFEAVFRPSEALQPRKFKRDEDQQVMSIGHARGLHLRQQGPRSLKSPLTVADHGEVHFLSLSSRDNNVCTGCASSFGLTPGVCYHQAYLSLGRRNQSIYIILKGHNWLTGILGRIASHTSVVAQQISRVSLWSPGTPSLPLLLTY